jgi:hypothetical protein
MGLFSPPGAAAGPGLLEVWAIIKAANEIVRLQKGLSTDELAKLVSKKFPGTPADVIARVVRTAWKESRYEGRFGSLVGELVKAMKATGEVILGFLTDDEPIEIVTPDGGEEVLEPSEVTSLDRAPQNLIRL